MHRPVIALATVLVSIGGGTAATAAAPPDDEAAVEVVFAAWAAQNGTPIDRFACDVTEGEGNVCFVLGGGSVSAFVPEGDGWAPFSAEGTGPAAGLATTFGDGTWLVGSDIAPGTYRTDVPEGSYGLTLCSWSRLSGFSGEYEDEIGSDFVTSTGPQIVEILPTDAGFSTDGCGTWTAIA